MPSKKETKTFWEVESPLRQFKFIHLLKMKFIFDETSLEEMQVLFDAPGVLEDLLFLALVRVLRETKVSKDTILQRYNKLCIFLGRKIISEELFKSWVGLGTFKIRLIQIQVRPVPKYTGYVKSIAAIGKGKPSTIKPDPETFEWSDSTEPDWYSILSIGRFQNSSWSMDLLP